MSLFLSVRELELSRHREHFDSPADKGVSKQNLLSNYVLYGDQEPRRGAFQELGPY